MGLEKNMKLRWFLSTKIRRATDACRHVRRLVSAQRDLLAPQALAAVNAALADTEGTINNGASDEQVDKSLGGLEKAADKWIKPYPHPEWRENIEVFLVAIVVAMGVRTFFLQPFKIPTGSMQPTLWGVTVRDLHDQPGVQFPGFFGKVWDAAVHGETFHEVIAPEDCRFVGFEPPRQPAHPLPFLNKQAIVMQYADGSEHAFTVWGGPDDEMGWYQTGLLVRRVFRKGEPIVRYIETTGDHLFVDRFTYNFRRPDRGEIVVFKTRGIEGIPDQNQFYIKRLVGLPGENISLGTNRHAYINGQELTAATPHFEGVYGFDPSRPPRVDHYSGHVLLDDSRCKLQTPNDSLQIPPRNYVVFGDNTMNSLDSRFWKFVPETNVIGKSFFVYWPFSTPTEDGTHYVSRFGWAHTVK